MRARSLALATVSIMMFAGTAWAQSPPGPPWLQAASPGGITLRWYTDDLPEAAARQVANAHCAATGRAAGIAAIELDGSAEIATYRCQ